MNTELHIAPMAGYTDHAFRRVLIKLSHGLPLVLYTEMVSATALFYKSKKTLPLLSHDKAPNIKNIVQLFGKIPAHFEYAIKSGLLDEFDGININMGCPAGKIIKNGEGSALMQNLPLAREIIRTCVKATTKPVSVKMRLGFEPATKQDISDITAAIELAKICEQEGVSKIIIHGRYASQGYSGVADWNAIAEVAKSTTLFVIANGDIVNNESTQQCLEITNASGIMVGRTLLGAPWKIAEISGEHSSPLFNDELLKIRANCVRSLDVVKFHLDTAEELNAYFPELKKHLLFYCNHLPNSKNLKLQIAKANNFQEARKIFGIML